MTDEELQKARELTLIERVALPHTMFEVRRTYKACADTIAALLAERERLISALEVVPGPITQEDLDWGVAVHYKNAMQEIEARKDERDALARDAAYWKEEARRYCENADFWRSKFEVAAMKGASNES